ncbi:MAG: sugar ABC transporter permease [Clostridia bacterium]|nr:sugar ABC transporter permease [Clostridia bacterium]
MKLNDTTAVKLNRKKQLSREIWQNRYLLLMLLPGLAYFIIFKYIPMFGLTMAFQDYSLKEGILGSQWVGLGQFKSLFSGADFPLVLKNTIVISLLKLVFGFPTPVILALMFNELREGPYKKITQTISYIPHFFSWVVMGAMLTSLLSPSTGIINAIIQMFGMKPIYFIADPKYFVGVLVVSDIWKEAGWNSVVYIAALSGINYEMHEAAIIDGASRLKRILYINLPSILPTVAIMLILKMGGVLEAGFDQIFNLYNVAVYDVADIIDTYTYRMGIGQYQYSYSAAAGMFKSVIGLILVLITNGLVRKMSDNEVSVF